MRPRPSAILAAALLSASPAAAADPPAEAGARATMTVYGTVPPACTVDIRDARPQITAEGSAAQDVAQVRYSCNSVGGFTRQIASANAGRLTQGDHALPYLLSETGSALLAFPGTSLTAPRTDSVAAAGLRGHGAEGTLSIAIVPPPGLPAAGAYSDRVTIELTPN